MRGSSRGLRIAIVSRGNARQCGASRFAEDLALWLLEAGHEVVHFCGKILGAPQPFQQPLYPEGFRGRLCRAIHRRTRLLGLNEVIPTEYAFHLRRQLEGFDVVHFHDHYMAYSPFTMGFVSKRTRAFFTAHDCLHFTGGCLYPLGCERYQTACSACPQRAYIGRYDFTRYNQIINRRLARRRTITYIYPSQWLLGEAGKSLRFRNRPVLIPYGFDERPYHLQARAEARLRLGVAGDRKLICISAASLANERKGVAHALKAAVAVRDLNPCVILVGNPTAGVEARLAGVPFWFSGYVESRQQLGLIYAAADVSLCCSLQENLPISVQEAMAAATPIVGFATGGIPDLVEDSRSGWLVPTGSQADLNRVLREALSPGAAEERGRAAQERVVTKFSPERCVQAHELLYRGETNNES